MEFLVEPLNKGHIGVSHFVLCREVQGFKMYFGTLKCVIYKEVISIAFIAGTTVLHYILALF